MQPSPGASKITPPAAVPVRTPDTPAPYVIDLRVPVGAPPVTQVSPPEPGMVWDGSAWIWPTGVTPGTPGPGAGNIVRLLPPGSVPG